LFIFVIEVLQEICASRIARLELCGKCSGYDLYYPG